MLYVKFYLRMMQWSWSNLTR